MLTKLIEDVFQNITKANLEESHDAIPHSDTFCKNFIASHGIDEETLSKVINILKESHKILSIEIVREDKEHDIEKVEGYIDADLITLRKLKNYFQKALVIIYEEEYRERLGVYQIIREIFPRINMLNNTPLGYIANKTIMLEEYEKLLEKKYNEYTEDWKANKLDELLEITKDSLNSAVSESKEIDAPEEQLDNRSSASQRAVDSESYEEFTFESSKYPLKKVLNIYGVKFFYRIHLRKYNFKYLIEVIESREIDSRSDLQLLKDMLKKVKSNTKNDSKLMDYFTAIHRLERTISRCMH